jgi:hypothetical protein
MNADQARLNEIHSKMRRIVGHKEELSAKQWRTLEALARAATERPGCPFCSRTTDLLDEIFK